MKIYSNLIKNIHPRINTKLIRCSENMIFDFPFFSEFFLNMNVLESKIKSAGVNITNAGINFYYDDNFINKLDQNKIQFLIFHEIFHILNRHVNRGKSKENKLLSNVVMDMIINSYLIEKFNFIGFGNNVDSLDKLKQMQNNEDKDKMFTLMIPKEYPGEPIFEPLYEWLIQQDEVKNIKDQGQSQQGQKGQQDQGQSQQGQGFDSHIDDEIDDLLADSKIKDIITKSKERGNISSEFEYYLKSIEPKEDKLKSIKKQLNGMFGRIRTKSWTRFNRHKIWGLKGVRKYGSEINVILDVSGSMNSLFERVLGYIYQNGVTMNMIQIDTEIKNIEKITSKLQLNKLKIKGLGGTILQPAVEYIQKNFNKYPTVILTDGYTDTLDITNNKKKVLILYTDSECNVVGKASQIYVGDK